MPAKPWCQREGLALLTDLYELTMVAGFWKERRADQRVCFEYFFRRLPPNAGFAVAAGLGPFLQYLENLRFSDEDIAYLDTLGLFDEAFLGYLRGFSPSLTVRAAPEGSLVFPYEPIVQVEGRILEAQLVETALLNTLNYQTLIATKAARICLAAEGEPVMEFGLRRAHGPDGGLSGSRAAYVGGCASTSNVLAGKIYDIPVSGTHAHSWVMSFPSELEAFRAFARNYPDRCVLLVDTYDTLRSGVPNAITAFKELHANGHKTRPAIRLDSGDLAKLSKLAHGMMTESGFTNPLIVASNDLDEDLIADLKRQGAKINAWGVGTHLITSGDCPALSGVYKLVAVADGETWRPRIKISSNIDKATDPGRKHPVRFFDSLGHPVGDVLYTNGEPISRTGDIEGRRRSDPHIRARILHAARGEDLFETYVERGERKIAQPPLADIRERAQRGIASLPDEFKRLRNPEIYRVMLSESVGRGKAELLENPDLA
ncbi:MAG TPA: nicotinate phosphoribosyltransferase [Candidatus Hydrogenedentes bacterium]|nr:nicotinate phosphoribosyltransferase [Candidatus Hydrogenedentota bacterium]